jgi:hypothetical protein
VHSGIEGGAVVEPMMDMFVFTLSLGLIPRMLIHSYRIKLLATLVDNNRVIQIPHFCMLWVLCIYVEKRVLLIIVINRR